MSRIDALNDVISLNFLFLPLLSMAIYVIWSLLAGRGLKSAWYISLGIPGALAFLLAITEYMFFAPRGYVMPMGAFPIFFPGYVFPPAVLFFHAMRFSKTEITSKLAYLLGIPIALTYVVTWLSYAAAKYG